jgi:hypothetical protein
MRLTTCAVLASAMGLCSCSSPMIAEQSQQGADVPCNVTAPNGVAPGPGTAHRGSYGNHLLAVGPFGLWPNGTVVFKPTGAGFQTPEGFLVMKFGWTLGRDGQLQVTGHRLDGEALPLRASIGGASEPPNFKPSYLIFSTPGCWEVNAQISGIADSKLTFVTRIVKVGEGPPDRLDPQ